MSQYHCPIMILTLTDFRDVVTIIALLVGVYVGLQGLHTWKKQFRANLEYKLANDITACVDKYKAALFQVRVPFMWPSEYPEFTQDQLDLMKPREKEYKEICFAYEKRWEKIRLIKPTLHGKVLESGILWGNELKEIFEKLYRYELKLMHALSNYLKRKDPKTLGEGVKVDDELIFDFLTEKDKFRSEINEIIEDAEKYIMLKIEYLHKQ